MLKLLIIPAFFFFFPVGCIAAYRLNSYLKLKEMKFKNEISTENFKMLMGDNKENE
jgi:hypothetical protein